MNTDTPRTNDIIEKIKGFRTSSAIYSLEQFSRLLERELTAAQDKIQTLSQIGIDQMDKERLLKSELKTVTEQLTEARRLAEKYRYLSCDSQEEADETLLPWEITNQPNHEHKTKTNTRPKKLRLHRNRRKDQRDASRQRLSQLAHDLASGD